MYIYMGFDALDAEHLVLAIDELGADTLVTKDRDFHERKKELKKRFKIEMLQPSLTISSLRNLR
jgi:predicted nuclease of predicted toxin-antitoxin system